MNDVKTVFANYGFEIRHSPNFDAILAVREIYPGDNPHAAFYANLFDAGNEWRIGLGFYAMNPCSEALLAEFNDSFYGGSFISNRIFKEGKPCLITDWLVAKTKYPKPEQALELFLYGLQVLRLYSAVAQVNSPSSTFKSQFKEEAEVPTRNPSHTSKSDFILQYQSGRKILLQGLTVDQARRETTNARKRNPESQVRLFKEFY